MKDALCYHFTLHLVSNTLFQFVRLLKQPLWSMAVQVRVQDNVQSKVCRQMHSQFSLQFMNLPNPTP